MSDPFGKKLLSKPFNKPLRQKDMMASEGLSLSLTEQGVDREVSDKTRDREREKELERIYKEHAPMVYNLCYRMLNNRSDAQDATQEVFVKVYKNLSKFAGRSKLSTWVYRITMNHCIDRSRRKKLPTVELEESVHASAWTHAPQKDHDTRIALELAVETLPPSYRGVFVLHDIQGFCHEEISKILKITPGSSKSLLHRSRMALRKKLKDIWRLDEPTPV